MAGEDDHRRVDLLADVHAGAAAPLRNQGCRHLRARASCQRRGGVPATIMAARIVGVRSAANRRQLGPTGRQLEQLVQTSTSCGGSARRPPRGGKAAGAWREMSQVPPGRQRRLESRGEVGRPVISAGRQGQVERDDQLHPFIFGAASQSVAVPLRRIPVPGGEEARAGSVALHVAEWAVPSSMRARPVGGPVLRAAAAGRLPAFPRGHRVVPHARDINVLRLAEERLGGSVWWRRAGVGLDYDLGRGRRGGRDEVDAAAPGDPEIGPE